MTVGEDDKALALMETTGLLTHTQKPSYIEPH
jgi:hypothetical protein